MNEKGIPKIIHYCWFGGNKKSKLVRDCISTWVEKLPDYEIIEWNETNSDLSHSFVKEAYRLKKWAFVADYIRLEKVYKYGGIYLDTDMLLLKNFDDLLNDDCFFGAEEPMLINAGIIGAMPKNTFIKECLLKYDTLEFNLNKNILDIIIPTIVTHTFIDFFGYSCDFNSIVIKNEVKIYPMCYFYPLPLKCKDDIINYTKYILPESYTVHLWVGSWVLYNEFEYLRKRNYTKGFRIVFKKIFLLEINYKYLRKVLSSVKESLTKNK